MAYTLEEVQKAVNTSKTFSSVLRCLGRQITGTSHKSIQKFIDKHKIDIRHFTHKSEVKPNNKLTASQILVLGTYKRDTKQVRRALLEIGRKHVCSKCGIDTWQNTKLVLEINHINGNNKDNREKNLEFLCPNCHSLTSNFYHTSLYTACKCSGKKSVKAKVCNKCCDRKNFGPRLKSRKVVRPTKEHLDRLIWLKPMNVLAKEFNVSDSAINKWCKEYKLDKPGKGYWQRKCNGLSNTGCC